MPNAQMKAGKRSDAKQTTHPKENASQSSPLLRRFLELLLPVLVLALYIFAYERTLTPIYASVPTNHLLKKIFIASLGLAALVPVRLSRSFLLLILSLLFAVAPKATYWVAALTARKKDPIYGPAITHILTLAPVGYLSTMIAAKIELTQSQDESSRRPIAAIICSLAASEFFQTQLAKLPFNNRLSDSQIYIFLSWLSCVLGIATWKSRSSSHLSKQDSGNPTRMKVFVMTVLAAFFAGSYPFLQSPVLPHPLIETYTRPDFPLVIHSSVQSVTGLISVGEALPPPNFNGEPDEEMHSVRYLRADHSILGGVWLGSKIGRIDDTPPWKDSFSTPLGDSIYSTFVLQESVRLVNSTIKGKKGNLNNALIIGLGAGISATAFNRHGVSTTIVEIDPAVYNAARTYFGLPDPGPGKVFLQDARAWVSERKASIQSGREADLFDFVVHDCFSGGGVPQHIFTVEFWEDLKATIHQDGIIAVNFAGQAKSKASRAITLTLEKVFGQCRAFYDSFEPLPVEKYETEFINIVFFCTSPEQPLTFRNSRPSDYLGSPLRQHVLKSLFSREINLNVVKGEAAENEKLAASLVLRDTHNPLGQWQAEEAFHHWTLMRDVLKDIFWETY